MERIDYQLIGVAREKAPIELAGSFLQAVPIAFLGYFLTGWLAGLVNPLLAVSGMIIAVNAYSCARTFWLTRKEILISGLSKLDRGQLDKKQMKIVISKYFCAHNALLRSSILSSIIGIIGAAFLANEDFFHLQGLEVLKLFIMVSIFGTMSVVVTNIFTVIAAEAKYLRSESIFAFFGEIDERTVYFRDRK